MKLFEDTTPNPGCEFDAYYLENYSGPLIGIDEAGRGPLAGPVVTAAVVLDYDNPIDGLNDSKKLTEKQRLKLLPQIMANAKAVGVGMAFPEEIDFINIFQATVQAMMRAAKNTRINSGLLVIDGLSFPFEGFESIKVIKGDQKSPAIMAASIVAKTIRDRMMVWYDTQHPLYGFAKHKGYGTKVHREAIAKHGACPIHRKTFEPVKSLFIKEEAE